MLVKPSPTPTSEALHAQQRVGWQPSRFPADRAEAEHAFRLAEQLGSVNQPQFFVSPAFLRPGNLPYQPLLELSASLLAEHLVRQPQVA
jgi:hypothetical protein